ncbi:MAG: hypothetical protein DF168_00193 [Candidatus Moanabacter tarae]|uniref:2-dehydropantoate 2-reductase n=1 Tax=Candidatus Moanibacter tarae TaxID=2200854 RepID=A0A2Z4AKB2_9BACT|nr:MAG: hypothetical protein DF168_00193 [Candidatus Moanabacter tarae]
MIKPNKTRYIIYGAGAIGCSVGGHLQRTGHQSVLIGKHGHIDRINESGLRLITPQDSYQISIPAVTSPSEIDWSWNDIVMLCMKSQDTEEALRSLVQTGVDTFNIPIFCVQNSITNETVAARYFERIYGVMVGFTGIYLEEGKVYNPVEGNAGYLEAGIYPSGIDDLVNQAVSDLSEASFAIQANSNIMTAKGAKLLGNLGNALRAICNGKGDEECYMERARKEAEQCLIAAGLPFEQRTELAGRTRAHRGINKLPANVRNQGSTWQSLMRRKGSTEADFLNGEIARLGKVYGIPTPFNRLLQRIVRDMARNQATPGKYTANELYKMAEELSLKPD